VSDAVLIEDHGPKWVVRLNMPERRNALGRAVVTGLIEAAEKAATVKTLRAIVLCGAGDKAFCAGADLKERQGLNQDEVRAFVTLLNQSFRNIETSPKVWIAAIHGACLGGGLELSLCADLRVAQRDAVLGLPEVRLGILPGAGGTQRLPRLIGMARAKELILTGTRITAAEALALGVVNRVADDHEAAAHALADEVCLAAPISVREAKRAVNQGWDLPLEEALALERACYEVIIPTQDRLEGLKAFAEKRAPQFKGE
jgi:methylglutaconyl-CoA hydratase